ncbi:fibrinolytic enzyme, isozyme C-like [Argopecten irradians]|uniref:fibrinolytic enzyme, isozyme C-like n=1 Tax=Argopecten irradians TaxID=31199 RepID=UPI003716B205
MMKGLVFVCALLVVESFAMPKSAPLPRHPSQDLIDAAKIEVEQLTNSRIIEGEDAEIVNNPWQVSLRVLSSHSCGGVILNSDTILTAAHCVDGLIPSFYSVYYGSSNRDNGGTTVSIANIYQHPSYNQGTGSYPNDIAVLKLRNPIALDSNENAAAIPLNTRTNSELARLGFGDCRITGWGRTFGDDDLPLLLQGANINVLEDSVCKQSWGSGIHDPIHICVGGQGTSGACNGDSGGPLVCKNTQGEMELVGVTSWGATGCPATSPSVYTEVLYFTDFIRAYM